MKYLLSILFVLLLFTSTIAQITLEQTSYYGVSTTQYNQDEIKYYIMNYDMNRCEIYNADYSLYTNINSIVPSNMYLYDVKFVTEHLFNNDDYAECLVTYYEYIDASEESSEGYNKYYTRIVSENGDILLDVPEALYSYVMKMDNEYKLFLYLYDYSSYTYLQGTQVYNIPGVYYSSIEEEEVLNFKANAYPNPASTNITIDYTLPEDVNSGSLLIYSLTGVMVKEIPVNGGENRVKLNAGALLPGSYLYSFSWYNKSTPAKKLIIK